MAGDGGEALAVRIERARKEYPIRIGKPKRCVVDDVSLSVAEGTIHGLLGPNGAGKTTTIKMLLGLVIPTAGVFEVEGIPSTVPVGRARLGFLPEQPYFPQQLTAAAALRLYGRLVGLREGDIRGRTMDLLELVGLEGKERVQVSKFSRGMLQRLGVAQALLGDPRVVVLDEPASGLDPVGQRDMRNLMLGLRERGVTVLLSSHQLSEVEVVCDRVTIMNRGRVAAEGHIDDLLNIAGQTSMRVRGLQSGLPDALEGLVRDVAVSGAVWVFSVADADVRRVVDAVDDAGGSIVSVSPKRESLEDYFSRLLSASVEGGSS
ncbi:MAG: ABC transporter ATP-binding protein [Coriobacteriia bacterium]